MKNSALQVPIPEWMPAHLREHFLHVRRFTVRPCPSARKLLRKRKRIGIAEWCERYRVLRMSAKPGPWRNSRTQYLTGIMEASFFKSVREINVCKTPQVGGSELLNNCLAYAADYDPGPAMTVFPDENTAKENMRDRITPMFDDSPHLKRLLTGRMEDQSALRLNLLGMVTYAAWATSVSRLANRPIRYLFLDEIDKYPAAGKREADPHSLALARTTTYRYSRKIWRNSTPTTESGAIWVSYKESEGVFVYHVRCPHCGGYHEMVFDQIKFPEDERDPEKIKNLGLAWYECPICGTVCGDADRDRAVRSGEWRESKTGLELHVYLREHQPKSVGFHVPAWLSPFVSLSECVAWFLKGQKNKEHLRHFMNAIKAEPWKDYELLREEDSILALAGEYPRLVVPGPVDGQRLVAALTAGIDTQDKSFYYVIRAWGYGLEEESWMVRCGQVQTFDALTDVLWKSVYVDGDGREFRVRFALQDAMGTRTDDVYKYCGRYPGRMAPTQGKKILDAPLAFAPVEILPGSKIKAPHGLALYKVNLAFFKGALSSSLAVQPGDPGSFWLHADPPRDYAKQMCAEYYDPKTGSWICPEGKDNHYWDCEVLARAAWHHLGGATWARPGAMAERKKQEKPKPAPQHVGVGGRPAWF